MIAALLALAVLAAAPDPAPDPAPDGGAGAAVSATAPVADALPGPGDGPGPTPDAPDEDGASEAPTLALPDHHGTRHAFGLGWHGTTFRSEEGSQYTFHSASLSYLGSSGARGVFVHASALLPLQARQDGRVFAVGDYYRPRAGADVLLGWQWRFTAFGGVEGEAGPGLHAGLLWLPGKSGYRDFSALPLGAGAGAVLRWRSAARAFSRPLTLGACFSAALDVWDPLRSNDLAHGFTFRLGMIAALGRSR